MKKLLMSLFVFGFLAVGIQAQASWVSDAVLREIVSLRANLGAAALTGATPTTISCASGTVWQSAVNKCVTLTSVSTTDKTPRIMFWPGAVNQHVDSLGNWQTDPDGKSGGYPSSQYPNDFGGREVEYCKKFYPNTSSVEAYKNETISTWRAAGNKGTSTGTRMSYKCIEKEPVPIATKSCPANFPSPTSFCPLGNIEVATKDANGCALTYKCTPNVAPVINPSITVLSPNGGESYVAGKTYDITWKSTGVENVYIYLFKKDASDVDQLITDSSIVSAYAGKYSWTIPATNNGGQFKVVVASENSNTRDFSDNYFTITSANSSILPDLTVDDVDITPRSGQVTQREIEANIINNSSVSANVSPIIGKDVFVNRIEIYSKPNGGGSIVTSSDYLLGNLIDYSKYKISRNFVLKDGSYSTRVCADATSKVKESNESNNCSNWENFGVGNSEISSAPVISGASGPQTLNVNESGNWSIKASNSKGGDLSYSVVWGDESINLGLRSSSSAKAKTSQSAAFTHTYSQAGTYTPTFTVTNNDGQSSKTSLSVNISSKDNGCYDGKIYSATTGQKCPIVTPSITVLSPNGGESYKAGSQIKISLSGGLNGARVGLVYPDFNPSNEISDGNSVNWLSVSSDAGKSFVWDGSSFIDNNGNKSYWTAGTGNYKLIAIRDVNNTKCYKNKISNCAFDISDNYFTITSATLTAPAILGNKEDLVSFSVKPGDTVSGMLNLTGSVKNAYFNEGEVWVKLLDSNQSILKSGFGTATTYSMTTVPVSFKASIDSTGLNGSGFILIQKNDLSGGEGSSINSTKKILVPVIFKSVDNGCTDGKIYSATTGQVCPSKSITLISPKSGSLFKAGQTVEATWKTTNFPEYAYIDVMTKKDGIILWQVSTINDGKESIKIPENLPSGKYEVSFGIQYHQSSGGSGTDHFEKYGSATYTVTSSDSINGCLPGQNYNYLTGQKCSTVVDNGCLAGYKYSSITGRACPVTTNTTPSTNRR